MKSKFLLVSFLILSVFFPKAQAQNFHINDLEYFEERGVNLLVYSNKYAGMFCDEKLAAIE